MKPYSDYLEVLKKMEQIQKLLLEMKDKQISEVSDEKMEYLQKLSIYDSHDPQADIYDLYFIDPEDVFELFNELDDAAKLYFTDDEINFAFCLSFHYRRGDVAVAYPENMEEIIERYRSALEVVKAWEDEDNQEDDSGRTYNVLVIQESNRNYYIDSDGHHNYCWEQQEIIRTNHYEKLFKKAEEISERSNFDYYSNKIFIDLDSGEEITLWDGYGYETESTDRATFYLKELGYDG